MDDSTEVLAGGNMSGPVVRIGDRVHRTAGPQAPTIHRVLAHVRAQGVTWVPRVHGFDATGREVLDFIPGAVVHDLPEWLWDEAVLAAAASALREWHDATVTYPRKSEDVWWQPAREPHEVICHADFAPYNHVFRDGRWVGAIDYDLCFPGPRVWDLAYTAYRYVPLTPHTADAVPDGDSWGRSEFSHDEQQRRLARFLEAYGPIDGDLVTCAAVLAALPERLDAMADWCDGQESADLRRNGVMYRTHARWIESGALADSLEP
ncbi:phosphotransferase [Demequina muriae]|uniref:Phosphotransferase n=1 Tax=Demequina muriae TaxID=3051664 RepID=A0ABT8GGS2_9MICO|nr:phosphotransferase [Demequina sp. EGI L300058]MDN4480622.1 phosphotransferase [Demequina sp. EGI L300058]